jgi:hypothetical protein
MGVEVLKEGFSCSLRKGGREKLFMATENGGGKLQFSCSSAKAERER